MTDDDIRSMLHTKAQEATVSDDAWDKIAARLGGAEAPVRHLPRRLALVGVAAAAVAGTVVVANLPGPSTRVATPPSKTEATAPTTVPGTPLPASVWAAPVGVNMDIEQAARTYVTDRTGTAPGKGELTRTDDDHGTVTYRSGPVVTEVFLVRVGGRWTVDSSASDLIPIIDPVYEYGNFSGEATPEVAGSVTVSYFGESDLGQETTETMDVGFREPVHLRYTNAGQQYIVARTVLTAKDGTKALSEVWASNHLPDPATAVGSMVAIWPATDSAGLAVFQQDADAGRRPDLLDPQAVAGFFLTELLPRNETPTSFALGNFQLGDNNSGEVPYSLDGKPAGTILLRRTGGDGTIWYATGATSDTLEILTTRHETADLVADVQSKLAGTLTWTGATSIPVQPGQKVSIGRPGTPLGNYPVVVRLMNGTRTLAIAAQLG